MTVNIFTYSWLSLFCKGCTFQVSSIECRIRHELTFRFSDINNFKLTGGVRVSLSACLSISLFCLFFYQFSVCLYVCVSPSPPPPSLSLFLALSPLSLYLYLSHSISRFLSLSLNIISPGNTSCHTAPSRFVFNLIQYLFAHTHTKKKKFRFDFLTCYFSIRDISFDELHRSLPSKWLIDFELAILTRQH